MGTHASVPSLPVEAIQECAAEVSRTFAPIYAHTFATTLVRRLADGQRAKPRQYLLEEGGLVTEPLWTGTLMKMGAVHKNWKKCPIRNPVMLVRAFATPLAALRLQRFVVVKNAADNFAVEYFTDEAAFRTGAPARGVMHLCWYSPPQLLSADDKCLGGGAYVLKLAPWRTSDRRRVWFLAADSEDTCRSVCDALGYACVKAAPPLNPDPVMREAFYLAYTATRQRLGEWGWFYVSASEPEQLAILVTDRCERTCMRAVYASLANQTPATAEALSGRVRAALDASVSACADAAWRSAGAILGAMKADLMRTANSELQQILDLQRDMRGRVKAMISDALQPLVHRHMSPLMGPLLDTLLQTLALAYEVLIMHFQKHVDAAATAVTNAKGSDDAGTRAWGAALGRFHREIYNTSGELEAVFRIVRGLTQAGQGIIAPAVHIPMPVEELTALLGGVELWQIERRVEDGIRYVARCAAHTLRIRTRDPSADLRSAIDAIIIELIHDCGLQTYIDVKRTLQDVIAGPIEKELLPSLQDLVRPVAESVPEPLRPFVDVNEMLSAVITASVDSALVASLPSVTATWLAPLKALAPTGMVVKSFESTCAPGSARSSPSAAARSVGSSDTTPASTPARNSTVPFAATDLADRLAASSPSSHHVTPDADGSCVEPEHVSLETPIATEITDAASAAGSVTCSRTITVDDAEEATNSAPLVADETRAAIFAASVSV